MLETQNALGATLGINMPRFYLDLTNGEGLSQDREGIKLPDLGAAGTLNAVMDRVLGTDKPTSLGLSLWARQA